MTPNIVLIHGRSQEDKNSKELKKTWLEALRSGLKKARCNITIDDANVAFPYYGDTLFQLAKGVAPETAAKIVIRGLKDQKSRDFVLDILHEIKTARGIKDRDVRIAAGTAVIKKGLQNQELILSVLRVIDRKIPGASSGMISLFTKDVYKYLTESGIRDTIEKGVREAIKPNTPTVVISHSLGTIVAFNLLRREGIDREWVIPYFITLGSPLAVKKIRGALSPLSHPDCVGKWINVMDKKDLVALFPLTKKHFDIRPAITNDDSIRNSTPNRHGIVGYLNNATVGKIICEAIMRTSMTGQAKKR